MSAEIIRQVGMKTAEGAIFRIDLRLRPDGGSGPLVRSLASCEDYYAQSGATWERMALIKARGIAGDSTLGDEFVQMLQPFVSARHAGTQIIQQMAEIKQRIEIEIVRNDRLTRHVKLGIGGIREIEFIVQSFQVLRGGRNPQLQTNRTLAALPRLVAAQLLEAAGATTVATAYRFLRNVEHRLQMEMDLQTHTIPDEVHAQSRLARSLAFPTVAEFTAAQNKHTRAVRLIYEAVLSTAAATAATPAAIQITPARLAGAGFVDSAAACQTIEQLRHGTGIEHVSLRTQELFTRLEPGLLTAADRLAEPDLALRRFETFVSADGSRGLLYELLTRNPKLVEMLFRLCDASKYFAATLAIQPDLFDEVCRGIVIGDARTLAEMEAGLHQATSADGPATAQTSAWKRAEMLRIGIGDVMEVLDVERVHFELTSLAEVCLRFALARRATNSDLPNCLLPSSV